MRKPLWTLLVLLMAIAGSCPAVAQPYPSRPVRLVVPYAPAGIVDLVARALGRALGDQLGQPVVIENRPGAGGIIGVENVVRSPPDGYSLLLMDPAIITLPALRKSLPYDVLRDLDTLSVVTSAPLIMVVNPAAPVRTLSDVLWQARSGSTHFSFASAGIGTMPHLAGELFRLHAGIELTHVPYRGGAPSMADLASGKVDFAFYTPASVLPMIHNGQLRAIGLTAAERTDLLPGLPTMAEMGMPDVTIDLWTAIFVPKGLPLSVRETVTAAISRSLAHNEVQATLRTAGLEARGTSAREGQQFIDAELKRWGDLILRAGITAD